MQQMAVPVQKMVVSPAKNKFSAFFMLTGFTFAAFASGFGVCLFDINNVDACVEVAQHWVEVLQGVGQHVIDWALALVQKSFNNMPIIPGTGR
jgi:hypothetical protein